MYLHMKCLMYSWSTIPYTYLKNKLMNLRFNLLSSRIVKYPYNLSLKCNISRPFLRRYVLPYGLDYLLQIGIILMLGYIPIKQVKSHIGMNMCSCIITLINYKWHLTNSMKTKLIFLDPQRLYSLCFMWQILQQFIRADKVINIL